MTIATWVPQLVTWSQESWQRSESWWPARLAGRPLTALVTGVGIAVGQRLADALLRPKR